MTWLMTQSAIDQVEKVRASVSAETLFAAMEGLEARKPHEMEVKQGGVAVIQVKGPLLSEKDDFLDYFGIKYTLYSEIQSQIAEATGRNANRIDFKFDSPGGNVSPHFYDTMKAIAAAPMKTRAIAGGIMASAAYMLASQTNRIEAESDLSMIGGVGVLTHGYISDRKKTITNTDSRKKSPDLATDDGVSVVENELDDVFGIIAEQVAKGRGVSIETIKNDYGQGAMMTARTALKMKMIDGIIEQDKTATKAAAATKGDERMDAKTLREEHRETYDAIFQSGVQAERDRVNAHLVAAEGGDLNAAHEAIKKGEGYSDLIKAKHDAFARNEALKKARVADNPEPIEPIDANHDDEQLETKKGLEASVPGLVWEVM